MKTNQAVLGVQVVQVDLVGKMAEWGCTGSIREDRWPVSFDGR